MHSSARGYMCAQACIYLAMIMMARHGGRVFGPTTITALAKPEIPAEARPDTYHPKDSQDDFDVWGLTARQVQAVAGHAGLSGHYEVFPYTNASRIVSERVLDAYVSSGFPVILFLDMARLHETEQESHAAVSERGQRGKRPTDHAVVVVGGSNLGDPGLDIPTIVIHDTAKKPYMEFSWPQVFEACAAFGRGRRQPGDVPKVGFVAYCPHNVKVSSFSAWRAAMKDPRLDFSVPLWRIRLVEGARLSARYFSEVLLWSTMPGAVHAGPPDYVAGELAGGLFWVIEQFSYEADRRRRRPSFVLGYDAASPDAPERPSFVLKVEDGCIVTLEVADRGAMTWMAHVGDVTTW